MMAINGLLRDERGQDLIEYTLLVSVIALGSTALFLSVGGNVGTVWESGATTLSNAASVVNPANPSDPGNGNGGHGDGGDGNN
jgi:Flp pilus assembly pilin Flp